MKTFIRYAQGRKIGKPNNCKVFWDNKPKGVRTRNFRGDGH